MISLDELLVNQFLNLLLQITTFISVVDVILMKTTVFLRVVLLGRRASRF